MILSRSTSSKAQELNMLKSKGIDEINLMSGEVRKKYITDVFAQEMIYPAKVEEAVAYLQYDPAPADLIHFPFLEEEIGLTAETAQQLCQLWLNMNSAWKRMAAKMESTRLKGTYAVYYAETGEAINAIVESTKADIAAAELTSWT